MPTNTMDTPLCKAVKDQDFESVRKLINEAVLIDECGADGVRPLYIAADKGYLEIVKILLENGANVNATNIDEDPPMVTAVKNGRLAVVCELMRYNPDVKACKPDCDPPLVIATDKEYYDIIIKLLENGASVDACRRDGDPPLVIAASKNNLKIVYELLKYEPNVNACKVDGDPPIIIATKNRNLEMVCALLNAKAEVNACWRLGDPSLVLAAQNNDLDIVREILKYKPRVDACRANGEPPLVIAVKNGNMEMVNDLLEAKANVDAFQLSADPALVVALQNKNCNIAHKIVKYKPDVNLCGPSGNTALIIAAQIGDLEMVCKLLDMGANAIKGNKDGLTPLLVAMENRHTEIAKKLTDYVHDMKNDVNYFLTAAKEGFIDIINKFIPYLHNIDICDSNGDTALMLAAQGGHSEVVSKLIEKGANIMQENNTRNTALGLAALNGQLEVVIILLGCANINIKHINSDGDTPIILAAASGNSEVIVKLIEYGADINDVNKYGITPIIKASESGHLHIIRQLKDYGANISNGITISPLDAAAQNGHLDCVKELIQLSAEVTMQAIQSALISNHVLIAQELLKIVSVFNIDDKTRLLKWVTLNNHDEIKRLTTNKLLLCAEYEAFQKLTILEIACYQWANVVTPKTIELLLDEGADPKIMYPAWQNRSAIHFATMGQNPSILYEIASRFDVNINAIAQDKNALIMLIVDGDSSKSFNECADILCDKHIDIHFNKYLKKSALTLAAERGYTQIINILLAKDNNITLEEEVTLKKLSGNFNYTTATQPVVTGASFLRNGNEDGFVSWYLENEDYENQHLGNESYLQIACNKHFIKVVNCLIQINPNQVGSRDKTHPLIIAIKNGYFKLVELFLGASNMNLPPNVLNVALSHVHKKSSTNIDYRKSCVLILQSTDSENERDSSGNKEYPLHNAVKYADADIISRLLSKKASLANCDKFENLTIKGIDYDVLKEHFDNCIDQVSVDGKKYLTFDYSTIIPTIESNKPIKETCAVLQIALDIKQRPLLQHPLISSFLRTKWQKVSFLFLANLALYLLFCFVLWSFVATNYNQSNNLPKDGLYICLCMLTFFIILRELFQINCMSSKYWTNVDNYLEIGLLIDVCLMLTTDQHIQPKFAIAILLSSVELLLLLGNIPGMSTYITMLRTVAYNFVTFFMFTSILVLAFSFSFYLLFHEFSANQDDMIANQKNISHGQNITELSSSNSTDFFSTISLAIFKTLIMFSGEIEASSLNLTKFPGFSHLFVICFTFLIVIILSNLLNGIAVSDTQKIKDEAKLIALASQAKYLNTIETTIYDWSIYDIKHFQRRFSFNCIFKNKTLKVDIAEELCRNKIFGKFSVSIPKFVQYFIKLSDSTIQEAQLIVSERECEALQTKVDVNKEMLTLKKMFAEFRNEMDAMKTTLNIIKNNVSRK